METRKNIVAQFLAPYKISMMESSLPPLLPEYAVIEYLYCGICGGDYSVYLGRRQSYPVSLGHEFVGRIISVGKNVTNLKNGQYVISDLNYRCGECKFCKRGQSHLCEKNNIGLFSNRGFAKYANIHASYLTPITPPDYLPRACLIEPLSCVIHACNYSEIHDGMRVLVNGGGGIGMLFCFYLCRVLNSISIILHQTNLQKADILCSRFPIRLLKEEDRGKCDIIVDCSNTVDGLLFSLDYLEPGGKICIMSHLYGCETSFVYEQLCKKELLCTCPLRNGERTNLALAEKYIHNYWTKEDDVLLSVHEDIKAAFYNKPNTASCKQIVHSCALFL